MAKQPAREYVKIKEIPDGKEVPAEIREALFGLILPCVYVGPPNGCNRDIVVSQLSQDSNVAKVPLEEVLRVLAEKNQITAAQLKTWAEKKGIPPFGHITFRVDAIEYPLAPNNSS